MTSSLDQKVLEHLTRYLAGQLTVADFHRWFMPRMWDLPQADPASHRFSRHVALRLAEFTSDHCTESELREALSELLPESDLKPEPEEIPGAIVVAPNVESIVIQEGQFHRGHFEDRLPVKLEPELVSVTIQP
jgi:hypothetical protein